MNKLTAIIPFLNEGIEVENTVSSIRLTAKENVDILLINDNSTDDFDYEYVAKKYNAKYIKNDERKGVAQSRNIGVSQITTPYFILLDAHMRFYQNDWWKIAIKYVEENNRAVYCFKCVVLDANGQINDLGKYSIKFGAYFNFFGNKFNSILEPSWIHRENYYTDNIPCVLGACYVMEKKYWDYLKGLNLLRYYGSDEFYLSLKVWFEGGHCRLIEDVGVGHIFRAQSPFQIMTVDSIYNKLLIAETLLPEEYIRYIHASMKLINYGDYLFALSLLNKNKEIIEEHKKYYKSIFVNDYFFIKNVNKQYVKSTAIINVENNVERKLDIFFETIIRSNTKSTGLMVGTLGEALFLFEYGKIKKNNIAKNHVTKIIEESLNNNIIKHYNLKLGAAGYGLGLNYLHKNGFFESNVSELFNKANEQLFSFMKTELNNNNYSYLCGATGIAYYFLRCENGDNTYLDFFISKSEKYIVESINNNSITYSNELLELLRFLCIFSNIGKTCEKTLYTIKILSDFILSHKKNIEKTDLSWLAGDLISGYSLLQASMVIKDYKMEEQAIEILLSTVKRQDPVQERIFDAGFSQGSSGVAYLYQKLYNITGIEQLKKAKDYWIKETFYKAVGNESTAFYTPYFDFSMENSLGLLSGISGIGLSFLSINNNTDILDYLFLLD